MTEQASKQKLADEKFKHDLAVLEATLYIAGRPLDLKTLGSVLKTRSKRRVQKLARALIKEYMKRNTALEILELEDGRFVMQLKAEYTPMVRKISTRPLLPAGPLKTLSYIAYRQPVLQKQVVEVRGSHAYKHIKQLIDAGLITKERAGRNLVLKTTPYFADYFGLRHDIKTMKKQLKGLFETFGSKGQQSKG